MKNQEEKKGEREAAPILPYFPLFKSREYIKKEEKKREEAAPRRESSSAAHRETDYTQRGRGEESRGGPPRGGRSLTSSPAVAARLSRCLVEEGARIDELLRQGGLAIARCCIPSVGEPSNKKGAPRSLIQLTFPNGGRGLAAGRNTGTHRVSTKAKAKHNRVSPCFIPPVATAHTATPAP
eukprot:scaffold241986_cov35-Tisochrysis_lutea.AAC.3